MIKVLIVDDHDIVRFAIKNVLSDSKTIHVVGEAKCGEDAVQLVRHQSVDIVLMDVRMPGIGGLEATRKILQHSSDTKVIAFSAYSESLYVKRFFQIGAKGFLSKESSPEVILQAILKVHHGQQYIDAEIAQRIALQPFQGTDASPFELLSERELQIALMIVNCVKINDISEKLFVSPKTVNSFRYRIFSKLQIDGDVELTHLALRYGLIESNPLRNVNEHF